MTEFPKSEILPIACQGVVIPIINAWSAAAAAALLRRGLDRGHRLGIADRLFAHRMSEAGKGWWGKRFRNSSSISRASASRPIRRNSSIRSIHFSGAWRSHPAQTGACDAGTLPLRSADAWSDCACCRDNALGGGEAAALGGSAAFVASTADAASALPAPGSVLFAMVRPSRNGLS
jgi:hypothetical protein